MQVTETFYQFLAKKLTIAEFEVWVYNTPELEAAVSEDDYLALLTLNYKTPSAAYELQKLLTPYIDPVELPRRELIEILETVANGGTPDKVLAAIISTWNWYLNSCEFLCELAKYGVWADDDFGWDPERKWVKMTERQKQRYLAEFYPDAQLMANHLIHGLISGNIQLHLESPDGAPRFTDTRAVTERKTVLQPAGDAQFDAQWWQFWK